MEPLRIVAAALVVYCHLVGFRAPASFLPSEFIADWIEGPAGIIWHFGYLGVALFFMISGFVIAHVAQRETFASFLVKRLFRIYPAALIVIPIAVFCGRLTGSPPGDLSIGETLAEMSLFGSRFVALSITYTLVIELMFYFLVALILPAVKNRPFLAVSAVVTTPLALGFVPHGQHGDMIWQLLMYTRFLTVFAMGMAIYYFMVERIGAFTTVVLLAFAWLSLFWLTWTPKDIEGHGFSSNVIWALSIFAVAYGLRSRIRVGRYAGSVASATFSIYLVHEPIARLAFAFGSGPLGYTASLFLALGFLGPTAAALHLLIDMPAQRFARSLLASRRAASGLVPNATATSNDRGRTGICHNAVADMNDLGAER